MARTAKPIDQTAAVDRVHAALPAFTSGLAVTARELAEATDLKYSTVTEKLRDLAADGRAVSHRDGRHTVWRRAKVIRTPAVPAPTLAGRRNGKASKAAQVAAQAAATPTQGKTKATRPGSRTADLGGVAATMRAARPVDETPPKAARTGQRTYEGPVARGEMRGFEAGELKDAVTGFLQDEARHHPGAAYTPVQVAKAIGAQYGSVAYALRKLANEGVAILAAPAPRRYQAA